MTSALSALCDGTLVVFGGNARDVNDRVIKLPAGAEGVACNWCGTRFFFVIEESGLATVSFHHQPPENQRLRNINFMENGWVVLSLLDGSPLVLAGVGS